MPTDAPRSREETLAALLAMMAGDLERHRDSVNVYDSIRDRLVAAGYQNPNEFELDRERSQAVARYITYLTAGLGLAGELKELVEERRERDRREAQADRVDRTRPPRERIY